MSYTDKIENISEFKFIKSEFRFFEDIEDYNAIQDIDSGIWHVNNKIFDCELNFTKDINIGIEFENCYFRKDVNFYKLEFKGKLTFKSCFFDLDIDFYQNPIFHKEFNFIDVKLGRQMYLDGGVFNVCNWSFDKSEQVIVKLVKGKFNKLNLGYWGGSSFKELSFSCKDLEGEINVFGDKTQIELLHIGQLADQLTLSIEDVQINALNIYRYRNEKSIRFLNIKSFESNGKESTLVIAESYLGKAEFYNVEFNSFKTLNIIHSHIVDCSFVNCEMKYKIQAVYGNYVGDTEYTKRMVMKLKNIGKYKNDNEVLKYFSNLREVCRQFKFSMGRQGDYIKEQKFHIEEMNSYCKSLFFRWSIAGLANFWTLLILKMSNILSKYGQSFSRPFWGLILGHLVLYNIMIILGYNSKLEFNIWNSNMDAFKIGFEEYFRLINPIRSMDYSTKGYYIFGDIVIRVWNSYMIYNLIRATRRFIK